MDVKAFNVFFSLQSLEWNKNCQPIHFNEKDSKTWIKTKNAIKLNVTEFLDCVQM